MKTEKVLFTYASLIREGMPANSRYFPDSIIFNIDPRKSHPLAITAGFLTSSGYTYWNEIDAPFEGQSVTDSAYAGSSRFLVWKPGDGPNGSTATTATFELMGVKLESAGLYTATVSLCSNDSNGNKCNIIDSMECHFVVSSEAE